jgi:hypothetical protein
MNAERGWLVAEPDGRFPCPRRGGTVDLARCLECNWAMDLDRSAERPALRCAAVIAMPDGRHASLDSSHVD